MVQHMQPSTATQSKGQCINVWPLSLSTHLHDPRIGVHLEGAIAEGSPAVRVSAHSAELLELGLLQALNWEGSRDGKSGNARRKTYDMDRGVDIYTIM